MTERPAPSQPFVRLASDEADRAAAYAVRHTVFVDEQGVPVELERDERDADADHFVATVDGRAIGSVRLVYLGAQTHAVGFYERLGYLAYGTREPNDIAASSSFADSAARQALGPAPKIACRSEAPRANSCAITGA